MWILGQPQTPSLALPQNPQKAPLATPQILESFFDKTLQRILGFCDDFLKKPAALRLHRFAGFGGFQAVGAGIYLVGNEQAHRAESTKSAQSRIHLNGCLVSSRRLKRAAAA
ncbi:hypothetical protein [Helicobacter canis]|uniref:hypothetical protein n=1 Tax=Helicobacter canis TaxID=29419 RepID=UPI001478F096|nr:hypothetical protein [Helicobacter canis]